MTAPKVRSVVCRFCDEEADKAEMGGYECPSCGRGIELVAWYEKSEPEPQ